MTRQQKRAYVLADNKLAMNAGWDEHLLAEELQVLFADDLDFNICIIGFSIPEIDCLIEDHNLEDTEIRKMTVFLQTMMALMFVGLATYGNLALTD